MPQESRVKKSLLNARVNLIFYFLTLALSFFSRKIFLDCLGADFVGLTGTLQNLLGFLNLAEFGIGTAISFHLYKPLQENNKEKINELISLFGYFYNKIGVIVSCSGIILSLFIPIIFKETIFTYGVIYFAFYSFLISNLIGYFINYRQIILSADQKNYLVAAYFQTGNIIKVIIQIALVYYYSNYYIWILVELIFNIIYAIILNWKINKEYPWLKTNKKNGVILSKRHQSVLKSTKQVFIHKIKDFLLTQSDQIFVFAFVSLKMVAYYGNYSLIITKVTQLFSTTLDSIGASIGNLVAEGNKDKILKVFWELMALRFFIAGLIIFLIYQSIEPFIQFWLGEEYILDHKILILLMINIFITLSRGTVDMFNNAFGLYGDIWAAWVEGIINLSVTIIAGYYLGIIGILLGKIISTFFIVILWKPVYLFKNGFKLPCKIYWKEVMKYYVIFAISFLLSLHIVNIIKLDIGTDLIELSIYVIINVLIFILIYLSLLYASSKGMRNLFNRIIFANKK